MAKKENEKVKSAAEMLYNLTLTDEEREYYDSRLKAEINHKSAIISAQEIGMKSGMEKGIEQGLEQGEKQKQIEIAKKMLKKKMDINEISEITGLTVEELEQI